MRHAPLLLLLALGCSETPPALDAGTDAPIARDDGADASTPPDVALEDHPDVVDAGGPDVVDAPAPVDAPDVVPVDAPEFADLVTADALDAAAPDVADAGLDAAADDAPDVQLADVVEDRPDVAAVADVVDAARDTGPVDAGPVVYDLNAVRMGLEVRVVYRQYGSLGDLDCEAAADMTNCFVAGGTLNFSLRGCGRTFTGLIPLSSTSGRLVTASGSSRNVNDFSPVVVFGRTASRQSFRVGVAMMPDGPAQGFAGIPGRTADPARGPVVAWVRSSMTWEVAWISRRSVPPLSA